MTSVMKPFTSESLLKNITLTNYLLAAQQTVLLKLIHDFRIEIYFMEK